MYTKPSKNDYATEAKAWRAVAVMFLTATRLPDRSFRCDDYVSGLCLAIAPSVQKVNEGLCDERLIKRMSKRMRAFRPKRRTYSPYWFSRETEEGRAKRVLVALKCAALCDKLAGEK